MNKAKLVAISGLCSAVSTICLVLVGLVPLLKWMMLFLGVIASVAVVIPLFLSPKNLGYSLLIYLVSSALGMILGSGNIAYVAPIVTFCIPFALVKACGEQLKVTAQVQGEQILEDPFDENDEKKVVSLSLDATPRFPKFVKWLLYFVLLNVGIGITVLLTYWLTPAVFELFVNSPFFMWAIVAMQLIVYPYDFLMSGCFSATDKILKRAIKP